MRQQRAQKFVNTLPSQYDLLRHIRGEAPPPATMAGGTPITLRPGFLTGGGI
ncbi:MAG: hypothetical protein AAFW68_14055 [Pseudomonadota bacterium]